MGKTAKRILTLVFGWIFVLLGIAGMFLPFLQGFLFLFLGLYLLSTESETARSLLDKLRKRYPALEERAHGLVARMRGLFRRD